MFDRIILFVLLLGLCGAAGGGCAQPAVKVDGSSTVYPIAEAVAEEFGNQKARLRLIVGRSGTGGGFKKFSAGETDICNASRPISDSEREACAANGIEFVELSIAFDGLTLVVHPENEWCDCLTVEQLRAIWQPNSAVKTWADLNPDWPNEPITLYGPGTDSGTFDYFTEAIVGKAGRSRDDYMQSEDDNALATGVSGDRHSLCYFGLAYYEENRDKLKLVKVDGGDGSCVAPSLESVRSNTYKPLSRPLYIYVRKSSLARPEVKSFVEFFVASAANERLIAEVGYVPVSEEVHANNKRALEEALATLEEASAAPEKSS